MSDDLEQRYAEAIAAWALMYPISSWRLAQGDAATVVAKQWGRVAVKHVMAVRDEEMERLRAELDVARTTRDETHIWTNTDWKERAETAERRIAAIAELPSAEDAETAEKLAAIADADRAWAEVGRLRTELERRDNAEAEAVADKTMLKGLTVEAGAMTLSLVPPREIVAAWVHAAREMIGDAENYVEMEIKLAGEVERFAFVLQRVGKLTPHEARQAAEAKVESISAAVDRVLGVHRMSESGGMCLHCSENSYPDYDVPWPCPTVQALNGEGV